jgi:SNF2 family DNA or RNA helicase
MLVLFAHRPLVPTPFFSYHRTSHLTFVNPMRRVQRTRASVETFIAPVDEIEPLDKKSPPPEAPRKKQTTKKRKRIETTDDIPAEPEYPVANPPMDVITTISLSSLPPNLQIADTWKYTIFAYCSLKELNALYGTCAVMRKWIRDCFPFYRLLKTPHRFFAHQYHAIFWMMHREQLDPLVQSGLRGGIVALHMGLGKTLVALGATLLDHLRQPPSAAIKDGSNRQQPFSLPPTLVVVPNQLLWEWEEQHGKYFDAKVFPALFYHKDTLPGKTKQFNEMTPAHLKKYKIVITTYDVISAVARKFDMADARVLNRNAAGAIVRVDECAHAFKDDSVRGPSSLFWMIWRRVITDESHRFSDRKSTFFHSLMCLQANYKWCMTGTVIRNRATDVWTMLRFCGAFQPLLGRIGTFSIQRIKHLQLTDAVHARDYRAAGMELPPKTVIRVVIPWDKDPVAHGVYRLLQAAVEKEILPLIRYNQSVNFVHILALFTRMRAICTSRLLLGEEVFGRLMQEDEAMLRKQKQTLGNKRQIEHDEAEAFHKNYYETHKKESVFDVSLLNVDKDATLVPPKFMRVSEIVAQHIAGEKIIVFSVWSTALELLRDYLQQDPVTQIRYQGFGRKGEKEDERVLNGHQSQIVKMVLVTGKMQPATRQKSLDVFRRDPSVRILLMTYGVGSLGLNLTEASVVICLDPWWSNVPIYQAVSRVHRTGQTRPVHSYHFEMEDSIETRMVDDFCTKKLSLNEQLSDEAAAPDKLDLDMIRRLVIHAPTPDATVVA